MRRVSTPVVGFFFLSLSRPSLFPPLSLSLSLSLSLVLARPPRVLEFFSLPVPGVSRPSPDMRMPNRFLSLSSPGEIFARTAREFHREPRAGVSSLGWKRRVIEDNPPRFFARLSTCLPAFLFPPFSERWNFISRRATSPLFLESSGRRAWNAAFRPRCGAGSRFGSKANQNRKTHLFLTMGSGTPLPREQKIIGVFLAPL